MRPVWMLHDSVTALRIGPDQYEVCELIGTGRMWRLWLPRQSPATIGHAAQGEGISPGAGQSPCPKAGSTGPPLPPEGNPFLGWRLFRPPAGQPTPARCGPPAPCAPP